MKCTKCNHTNEVIELDWISDKMIRVEGFTCKKCHHVNICRVTDNALRSDLFKEYDMFNEIKRVKYTIEKHKRSSDANTRMTQRIIQVYEKKLEVLDTEYNKLKKANNIRCKRLIQWYEQERSLNGAKESILRTTESQE